MTQQDSDDPLLALGSQRGIPMTLVVRRSALPYADLTYSVRGEDMLLKRHFKRRLTEKGIYVDVGCSQVFSISNTFGFYCLGWRGLCVDANPFLASSWREHRPEDQFVAAAVGETPGETQFFLHRENQGMSVVGDAAEGDFDPPVPIPVERLDALLSKHIGERRIQFLSIDVEGGELGVLRSNDWRRWRPEVVLMECAGFDFTDPFGAPTVAFLREQGYRLDQRIGANVLMVESSP
jgi:FkbM family methyltransferase